VSVDMTYASVFYTAVVAMSIVYYFANVHAIRQESYLRTLFKFVFIYNINNLKDSFRNRNYLTQKITWTTIMEGILALYFLLAIIFQMMYTESRPFLVLFASIRCDI